MRYIKQPIYFTLCFGVGIDADNEDYFLVYRLEKGRWIKIGERKWMWRVGHSCEFLDEDTMAIIGGVNYYNNIDILDLGSLSWSKVKIESNQSTQKTGYLGFRVLNFLYILAMTSPLFIRVLSLSYNWKMASFTAFRLT